MPDANGVLSRAFNETSEAIKVVGASGGTGIATTTAAETLANGTQTTVGSSAVQVLAANTNRVAATIQNVGATNMRVGITGVSATTGYLVLASGGTFKTSSKQAIFAIRDGSSDTTAFAAETT